MIKDLKQRGLLDDTLVIWGGEFGRTIYSPGQAHRRPTTAATTTRAASPIWLAGGGIKPGITLGETDDFSLQHRPRPGVEVYDLQRHDPAPARRSTTPGLTYSFQGRDFRLTDVHGRVVRAVLS